ncbi:MAG TPA: dihydroorotase [Vicinamibacteria bacterium]|nr:dihydroorotase [Vicinamibacteria bacterium]
MRLVVSKGRVIDPVSRLDATLDILVEDGRIAAVGPELSASGATILDASGRVVVPGLIDMHVHLREPGFEHKETIESGTAAAAAGGFTAVVAMANTSPVNDTAAVTEYVRRRSAEAGKATVFPVGAITKGLEGKCLTEIGELVNAGVVAVSDDGHPVENPLLMRRAMEYSTLFDVPIIEHCETPELHPGGSMHEGFWSTCLGLRGIPAASEEIAVRRNVALAELTGARLHVAHLSTRGALQAVREAKRKALPVTCEVTPHHLLLTDEAVRGYDTNTKMMPPLRSEEDRQALWEGLADGTVDAIATDHAPHHLDDKCVEYDKAAFGVVGLETAVPLCLDRLVDKKIISLSRLVELLSSNPARILGLPKGSLAVGADADITILDLERTSTVRPERFQSKGRNTPFAGWELRGGPVVTVVGGRIVWQAHDEAM